MALFDHNGESEFPFSKNTVFDAICKAIPSIDGMKIENSDKLAGRIMVKAGMTLFSWGENIPIQLSQISKTKTGVRITSTPKINSMGFGLAGDMGKNRENIEKILVETSKILSTLTPELQDEETIINSVADEIQKFKNLLDAGILTDEEFRQQKMKLLK